MPQGRTIGRGALLTLLGLTGATPLPGQADANYGELQVFADVLNLIRINYVDSVSYPAMVRAAVDGVLRSLDPHSRFVPREAVRWEAAMARGELASLGLVLEDVGGTPTVLAVTPDGPAARKGIASGDRLVEIGDTAVSGRDAKELERALAGQPGSRVILTFDRGDVLEPVRYRVTLRRERLRHISVGLRRMLDDSTGYVRLDDFARNAAADLEEAMGWLRRRGAVRLVLDLRGNPGGNVDAAVDVAALFLPRYTVVFRTRGRTQDQDRSYATRTDGRFRALPTIVLVDPSTASAAEAVAASLQDHDRALVVGQRTFGKALLQQPFTLPAGDVVWLTVGWVFSPSGRLIQRPYAGLRAEAYQAMAGRRGAADTLATFRTTAGRDMRGGSGVAPDVAVAAPPNRPAWDAIARDSLFDQAVADSVAFTLSDDRALRDAWVASAAQWDDRVVSPYLDRVRRRLGVAAEVDERVAGMLARDLAARVAERRWGPDVRDDLLLRHDVMLDTALALFPRLAALLASPTN